MASSSAIDGNPHWVDALIGASLVEDGPAPAPDLALFFASPLYPDLPSLVGQAYRRTAASVLAGCSGQGVVGVGKEIEGRPGLSVLNLDLPGTQFFARHVEQDDLESVGSAEDWWRFLGAPPDQVNAWVVFADPFTFNADQFIYQLQDAYPGTPIVGGLASGLPNERGTAVFLNDQVFRSGAVIVGLGGAYTVRSLVAQGAMPIGEPWTITSVDRDIVWTIGNRPALEVLRDTLEGLSEDMRERASRNLLVGLAIDEYKDELQQGDFLIRNLMGVDRRTGAVGVNALPRVGQTIQFQIRDALAADEDLRQQLARIQTELEGVDAAGGLMCTCNGRGVGLFEVADHDAQSVKEALGDLPLSGFFCNGEIGPVGQRIFLHGFTASLAFFVPKDQVS